MSKKAHHLFFAGSTLVLGLLAVALTVMMMEGQPAGASSSVHYVAPGGDCAGASPCYGTVQNAVDAASGGEVKIASGTYTDVNAYGGLAQAVYVSNSVTLRGGYSTEDWMTSDPEANPTVLDARGRGRVLYVTGNITVAIEGLTMTGGNADGLGGAPVDSGWDSSAGGGVYAISAAVTISHSQILSNMAGQEISPSLGHFGGGIFVGNGRANIVGSVISDNTAGGETGSGGGISLWNSTDNTILSNTIAGNAAMRGGGVLLWNRDAETMLAGNTVLSNTADSGGGLSVVDGSFARILRNTISGNASLVDAGGISIVDASAVIEGNTVANNEAGNSGGGLDVRAQTSASTAIIADNEIYGNVAGNQGGGIQVLACGTTGHNFRISGNVIRSNAGPGGGGGVALQCFSGHVYNNIVADNQVALEEAVGGVYIDGTQDLRLLHNTLARNGGTGVRIEYPEGGQAILTNNIMVGHRIGVSAGSGGRTVLVGTLWGSGDWANGTDWLSESGVGSTFSHERDYWGDPEFTNPSAADYHIQLASAALDRGVMVIAVDIDGETRPQGSAPDLGADEVPWLSVHLPLVLGGD